MLAQAAAYLVPCPLLSFHKRIEDMDTYNETASEAGSDGAALGRAEVATPVQKAGVAARK
jgi:hypothetical protein